MSRVNHTLRFLDQYLGPPILSLLSILRSPKRDIPLKIKRIAIVRTAAIGDTLLISGVISDIKAKYPKSELVFISGTSNSSIVKYLFNIDRVLILKSLNPIKNFGPIRSLGKFDVVINFGQWPNIDAIVTWMVRSKIAIGFETPRHNHHLAYDIKVPHSDSIHEIDNFRNLVIPLEINSKSLPKINSTIIKENKYVSIDKKYITLIPWCSGRRKNFKEWPSNNWKIIINEILKEDLGNIVLLGVNDDYINSLDIASSFQTDKRVINLVGKTSFDEFISIIKNSSLVISVNTGGMHIASALNIPLISLDGIVPSKRWGPVNSSSISLECTPEHQFIHLGFEFKDGAESYMNDILPEQVLYSIFSLIYHPLAATNKRMSL